MSQKAVVQKVRNKMVFTMLTYILKFLSIQCILNARPVMDLCVCNKLSTKVNIKGPSWSKLDILLSGHMYWFQ